MFNAQLGNLLQQRLRLLRILINPRLALLEQLRSTALRHVTEQRPRSATEANERHAAIQLRPRHGDGLVHIVQLLGHIAMTVQNLAVLAVIRALERAREVRALLVDHLDRHAHGLGNHENVGEDDGGVDEAGEALDWLESQGRCDLGAPADLEEVLGAFGFVVLGEVAAGFRWIVSKWQSWRVNGSKRTLSHHPYWRPFNLLSCFVSMLWSQYGCVYAVTDPMPP